MSVTPDTTVTDGNTTLHPELWMDYKSAREANTKVHALMGGNVAITLAPSSPRTVNIALLFESEHDSKLCEDMHAGTGVITITETDRATASMQYVVVGKISRELDPDTSELWIVSAEVIEVGA